MENGDPMQRANEAHRRLDEHEEVHQQFDRRISSNEDYRLQAIGALKILAFMVGAGGIGFIADVMLNIF